MKRKRNLKVGDGLSPSAKARTLDPARHVHGRPCGHGGLGPPARTRRVRTGDSWPRRWIHRRCSSSAQFRLTRFSVFPFSLAAIRDGRVVRDTTGAEGQLPRTGLYRPIFTHFVAEARRVVQDHAPLFCTMKLRTARGFRAGHRATSRRGFLGAFR